MNILNINYDIIDNIINILNPKNKIIFICSNKVLYKHYYFIIHKYSIYKWLHTNYDKFYNSLQMNIYSSDDINQLLKKSILNVQYISNNRSTEYDIRYIFELLFKGGYTLSKYELKVLNPHLYIHFIQIILKYLSDDRSITLKKINKSKLLFSLQPNLM